MRVAARQALQRALVLSEISRGSHFRSQNNALIERVSPRIISEDNLGMRVVIVPKHTLHSVPEFRGEENDFIGYQERLKKATDVIASYVRNSGAIDHSTGYYPQRIDLQF